MIPNRPRMAQLVRDLAAGASTIEAFWQEMAEHGTPLAEPLEGTDDSLVTFLYRQTEPVEAVQLKELVASEEYLRCLTDALLPWARERFNATADPAQTIVGGSSASGFAAAFAALCRPDVFGNVLSQSGMYYWSPKGDTEPEWLVRQYAETERRPVRFYLEAGKYEFGVIPLAMDESVSPRQANRHFRDVLQTRGYPVVYRGFPGCHDYIWWRGTLGDGLQPLAGTSEETRWELSLWTRRRSRTRDAPLGGKDNLSYACQPPEGSGVEYAIPVTLVFAPIVPTTLPL